MTSGAPRRLLSSRRLCLTPASRYVGTLHEINSENSTVALENVTSFGTEGRRNGEDEIAASDNIYEYIVFRGSDVKDLRIEDKVEQPKPAPPPMPNDPAILGVSLPSMRYLAWPQFDATSCI